MAKDDYDVITYKILIYLYACFKCKIIFDEDTLNHAIGENINQQAFENVLRFMLLEDLVSGISFKKCWRGEYILINDLFEMEITPEGIHYLKENSRMKRVQENLMSGIDVIISLIKLDID